MQNEIAGRLIHYAEWFESSDTPRDLGARMYTVIHSAVSEELFLAVFDEYWATWLPGFIARTEQRIAAAISPSRPDAIAGARANRDEHLANAHRWVVYFWQRGGQGCEDVQREYVSEYEAPLNEIAYQVALDPTLDDAAAIRRAKADIRSRIAASAPAQAELSGLDVDGWLELRFHAGLVSEARRRLRHALGETLRLAEAEAKVQAKSPGEYAALRRGAVNALFNRRLGETATGRDASKR